MTVPAWQNNTKKQERNYLMKATNSQWATDGDQEVFDELPTGIEIPKDFISKNGEVDKDAVSDYISDETGFCHYGFEIEK